MGSACPHNPEHLLPGCGGLSHSVPDDRFALIFSWASLAWGSRGGPPSSGPRGHQPRGTEGPERVQRGVTRAPGRRRFVIFFLDESPGLRQPRASPRPAANLSAVGLSQHAVWKAKVFNVNFVLPSLSPGIHRCSVSRRFLSRVSGAEI